jgi:hypothetical protein
MDCRLTQRFVLRPGIDGHWNNGRNLCMRRNSARLCLAAVIALVLGACATRSDPPVSATLAQDDDAICRANNVAPGSPEYIACRKDRDALRDRAAARSDRRQHDLGDYMMNHPDHP